MTNLIPKRVTIMKLREFIKNLQLIAEESAETLDFDVVCSRDDEGNGFNGVYFTPTIGTYDGEHNGEFDSQEGTPNAVCVN